MSHLSKEKQELNLLIFPLFRTDAAGAMVDGGTTVRIENTISLEAENKVRVPTFHAKDALRNHNTYNYFFSGKDDSLIITGPTGTNVADICITLVR